MIIFLLILLIIITMIMIIIIITILTRIKLSNILLRFYFHDVLEELKTNFPENFRFESVLGFVIEDA